jgi:threonine synthase
VSYDYKSVAGLRKLVTLGLIKRDELTVAFITGAGLKTQGVVAERIRPLVIQRTLESFKEVFGK